MKRILFLTSCFILTANVIAQTLPPLKNSLISFKAVHWKITLAEGGFNLLNNTDRNEIIQVIHTKGSFGTFKQDKNHELSCVASFEDDSHQLSTICVLAPGEQLNFDLDFSSLKDAEGTYQVAFEN